MQDFGTIPGLARRVLGAGGGGRLRGYSPPTAGQPQQQAPVKCPRCDSTNTKFCYYNNYNLAQPRHFCKSCRRYWTKGGVLRNVPVGGGCRKSKRSSSSSASSSKVAAGSNHKDHPPRHPSTITRSGSGSSGNSTLAAAEASTSGPFHKSTLVASRTDLKPDPTTSFDPAIAMEAPISQTAEAFPDTSAAAARTFTSLVSPATAPVILGFGNFFDPLQVPLSLPPQPNAEEDIGAQQGFTNQTSAAAGCGFAGMEWPSASVDPAIFDLAAAVDPAAAYWSHGHWGDADPALYLP
ncbi:hypothetical protein Cni_G22567 [Canna indica]|uniref:Dof zinc finger protein n=1 Tax=Canna indica TaxID=4628 RepID=A0AAQ3KRP2_9LILI|nr:hypothetical protein Cni_G22567 [Canna indica]